MVWIKITLTIELFRCVSKFRTIKSESFHNRFSLGLQSVTLKPKLENVVVWSAVGEKWDQHRHYQHNEWYCNFPSQLHPTTVTRNKSEGVKLSNYS